MKERPILFTAPMVLAILDGRKTQTWRPIKAPWLTRLEKQRDAVDYAANLMQVACGCPYGVPGDRLWVRETFIAGWPSEDGEIQQFDEDGNEWPRKVNSCPVWYRADPSSREFRWIDRDTGEMRNPPWRSALHMPRWASRLTLEITDVRVQRVNEISEEWDSINAERGFPWDSNPWVWALTFRRLP
ncbi:MAG: hypothetical protein WCA44_18000 [Acidobacteriaceae bacterium]